MYVFWLYHRSSIIPNDSWLCYPLRYFYLSCSICIWNFVILFHIILTCTEKELLWSLNIDFVILMGISVFGYHKLKKVLLFTKCLSVYMSYSALERNLFDRFPPNSQQKYKLGQYRVIIKEWCKAKLLVRLFPRFESTGCYNNGKGLFVSLFWLGYDLSQLHSWLPRSLSTNGYYKTRNSILCCRVCLY